MTLDEDRRRALLAALWFGAANTFLLVVHGGFYLFDVPESGLIGWLFLRVALVAQIALAGLIVSLVVAALAGGLGRHAKFMAPLAGLLFIAAQFFVLLDRKQYALFKFHLNGLAINILTTPGGWESMHVSTSDLALVIGGLVLGIALESVGFFLLVRRATPGPVMRPWLAFVLPVLVLGISERAVYAWADLNNVRDVTRSARIIPLYQPFTVKRIAKKWFHVKIDDEVRLAASKSGGNLKYPRAPLVFAPPSRTPNILWLTLDSFRYDALSPELTPRIDAFSRTATVFDHQISGGNSTRYGVFSMFYGLHGSYWQTVLAERRGPVFVSRLRELGYRTKILSSTSLTWPEFRRTAFVEVGDSVEDAMPGPRTKDRDRQLTERFSEFLENGDTSRPFFAWLFFDSTHAPYDLEEKDAKITPFAESVSYANLDSVRTDPEMRKRMFNRYKNAVSYLDGLCGKVIDELDHRGLLENTIVVITGDHGEEYYEHGYFGHNGAFTPEQIHVPLVIFDSTRRPGHVTRMTTHQDLVPTFMELLGTKNPPADYSVGANLYGDTTHPFAVSCAWAECAVVDSRGWLVFGTEAYNASGIDVLDPDYKEVDDRKAALRAESQTLIGVMGEMSAFLR